MRKGARRTCGQNSKGRVGKKRERDFTENNDDSAVRGEHIQLTSTVNWRS